MDKNEINALITLLDDTDKEVVDHVTKKLLDFGHDVIPILEDRHNHEANQILQQRIQGLIHEIRFSSSANSLISWAEDGAPNLFDGIFLLSKYRYPNIDKQELSNQLDKIKLDAWLELSYNLSSLEKVRILNHNIYKVHGFKGNNEDYHAPENSYLNKVLETKRGNPISLAIVYSIVAQRLNIPIFGVNLPQHFVLAYRDDAKHAVDRSYKSKKNYMLPDEGGDVMFYINAFNQGVVFSKWNIDQFLKQLKIEPQDFYYEPCSNVDIVMRVLRNLVFSYEKLNEPDQMEGLKVLLSKLQPYSSIP